MSHLRRRLHEIENRHAFQQFQKDSRIFEGRSQAEIRFFSIHGFFSEAAEGELPIRQDFCVGGIRTIVTTERSDCNESSL